MPGSTTTVATVIARVQDQIADSSTSIWDETTYDGSAWQRAINDSQLDIYNDIVLYKAWELCDALDDSIEITIVDDQEVYDWHNLITVGASKTYYAFRKATWGNYRVSVIKWDKYSQIKNGIITPTDSRPFMSFYGDGTFYLRPLSNNGETFTFYFVKPLTATDATTETFEIDERCIPLMYPKVRGRYWQRRGIYERWRMEEQEYERLVRKIIKPFRVFRANDVLDLG